MVLASQANDFEKTSSSLKKDEKNKQSRLQDEENILDYLSDDEDERSLENELDEETVKAVKKKTKVHSKDYETDYWKLPKKYVILGDEDKEKLQKAKKYYDDVIDTHNLIVE